MSPRDYGLEDELGDDEGIDFDGPPQPQYRNGMRVPTRCAYPGALCCPCDFCTRDPEGP